MGTVPFHESGQQEVYGVSEDCRFNDHLMCRSPRCGCSCHRQAVDTSPRGDRNSSVHVAGPVQTGLDKYCPVCKDKCPSDQFYCRKDGTKLSSLRCPECNTPGDAM